jgi:hypothetical protein
MNTTRIFQVTAWLLAGCGTSLGAQSAAAPAAECAVGITAVSSRVSKDYVRTRLPDGSIQPEEYAFGDGGRYDGTFRDASVDKLKFMDVARVIAVPLKSQNYVPANDITTGKLLIMVHWGTTNVSDSFPTTPGNLTNQGANKLAEEFGLNSPQAKAARNLADSQLLADDLQREHVDFMNAKLLGYDSENLIGTYYGSTIGNTGMLAAHREELIYEIEENRYFVVLIAYDFQLFRREKKLKALWETRFSINEPRNDFAKALPVMAQYASKYFGQDSHGLLRTQVPEGKVKVGEPKSLGELEAPQK